jgi:hypothetical protein
MKRNKNVIHGYFLFHLAGTAILSCGMLWGCQKTDDAGDSLETGSMSLKFVVKNVQIPRGLTEYSTDLDGDGKADNRFIDINTQLTKMGQDMAQQFYDMFSTGTPAFLVEASSAGSGKVQMQMHFGDDTSDTADRFSGSAGFTLAPEDTNTPAMIGSYQKGKVQAGPGNTSFPLPKCLFMLSQNVIINVVDNYITAKITEGEIQGQINACIPWSEVQSKILPSIVEFFNNPDASAKDSACRIRGPGGGGPHGDGGPPRHGDGGWGDGGRSGDWEKKRGDGRAHMLEELDTDKDGKISADEVLNHRMLKDQLVADIDTDKDGKKDCLSFGVGFTAVTASW